ncbi:uncharacterized protein LOC143299751 [Babylonia areolata]|uniref:uncharacterized protein LOC143299751 n=1 Tax=Babylonia areolata TaxID=304850 RepID=UPI003FCFB407
MADIASLLAPAVLVLFLSIGVAQAGNWCLESNYKSYTYCTDGCCGSSGNQYCCGWSPTVGLIVGCVFGGIFLISVIVAVVCCCIKKKAHSGKVVSPAPGSLQARPGAGTSTTFGPPGTTAVYQHTPNQTVAFIPGTGVYQQPPPGYTPHQLPPLSQPPTYMPPAPPPAYDMYSGPAGQQQQQQQQQQLQTGMYGFGQAGTPQQGMPTTAYGNNFAV